MRLALALIASAVGAGCSNDPGSVGALPGGASGAGALAAGTGGAEPSGGNAVGGMGTLNAGGAAAGGTGSTAGLGGTGGGATAGAGGAMAGPGGTAAVDEWGTPAPGGPTGVGTSASVKLDLASNLGAVGPDFVGFSYEKTQIANASLSSANNGLVALYKLLGTPSLRIGANNVDECLWVGQGTAPAAPHGQPFSLEVNTGNVDQLCDFLAATGSRAIYAVNFKLNDVATALADASYVMSKCPQSVYTLEIGNETNLYPNDGAWAGQKTRWETFGTALTGIPGATLSGAAVSNISAIPGFLTPFAAAESAKFGSKLVLLTSHFYVGGAGDTATVANLLTLSNEFTTGLGSLKSLVTSHGTSGRYRLDEANSFYNHGQPGVSDTLVQGLWSLDVMFQIAAHDGAGINFHGGETGMDGTRPFYYQPLKMTNGVVDQVQPLFYGMLLFAQAGQGTPVATNVVTASKNFTAYAIKGSAFTSVVLVNKSSDNAVAASVDLGVAVGSASAIYLQGTPAGSLTTAADGVTLAGASISPLGLWPRKPAYIQTTAGNIVSVHVPAASAALVRIMH